MPIDDLWRLKDGSPSKRDGRGLRYRVRVAGYPATSHRTRSEAQQVERDRIKAGPPTPKSTTTVGELLDRWLAGKQGLSANGLRACKTAVRQARPRWGDVLASDVTQQDVKEWLAGLQSLDMSSLRIGGKPSKLIPASGSTKAKALRALSGAMEIGVGMQIIGTNPCQKVSPGTQAKRAVVTLEPAELRALADAAGGYGPMMWFLGTTGLRISECVALNVGDVHQKRKRVMVRASKNGEAREVPIPASVLGMLKPQESRPERAAVCILGGGARVCRVVATVGFRQEVPQDRRLSRRGEAKNCSVWRSPPSRPSTI